MWLIGVGAYFWFKILCILYRACKFFQFLHPFGRFGVKMGIASMSLLYGYVYGIWYMVWYGWYTAITHVWLSIGTSKNINPDRYGI